MKPVFDRAPLLVTGFAFLMTAGCQVAPTRVEAPGAYVAQTTASGAKIDPYYSADGLRKAFAQLCGQLRYRPINVEIDQSEFPFIVYGRLEGRCDYREIRSVLETMPGYAYAGCVTSVRGNELTVFALNMTPHPIAASQSSMQQLMSRMQALANTQR